MEAIRTEIEDRGPITFARFMERALTEPGIGYYASSELRPTRAGDFLTAPELHPFFGRCVGRQLDELWERIGRPDPFTVVEYGAGRGTLEASVRAGLDADALALAPVLRWIGVDVPGRGGAPPAAPIDGCVVANEYLDALPVHRLVQRDGLTHERYVEWRDGWFAERLGPLSDPRLGALLHDEGIRLTDGQSADVSLAWGSWVGVAAGLLARGAILVIDYGHPAHELYGGRRAAGTLRTYRGHRAGDDPFVAVGRQDITAHVDLSAVTRAARDAGLDALGITTQAEFLAGLGLGELLSSLGERPATEIQTYLDARSAVYRLVDPRHLGRFAVLVFGRGVPAEPPLRGLAFRIPSPDTSG